MHLMNLAALSVGIVALSAAADTITVCPDGSCDYTDPSEASMAAVSGDVIEIAAGTYLLDESISLIATVTMRGAVDDYGQPATVLDGQGAVLVLGIVYADQSVLENLVITNGYGDYGGGARFIASSDVVVRNCHFRGNHANWDGGGIRLSLNTSLILVDCEVTDNTAEHPEWGGQSRGAGVQISGGTLILEQSRVCGNVGSDGNQISGGTPVNLGGCIEDECNVCVTTDPMTILLGAWGGSGPGDLDHNGIVDGGDLSRLLGDWG
jgi:hypothetical protein